jgi:hypothetical protein
MAAAGEGRDNANPLSGSDLVAFVAAMECASVHGAARRPGRRGTRIKPVPARSRARGSSQALATSAAVLRSTTKTPTVKTIRSGRAGHSRPGSTPPRRPPRRSSISPRK